MKIIMHNYPCIIYRFCTWEKRVSGDQVFPGMKRFGREKTGNRLIISEKRVGGSIAPSITFNDICFVGIEGNGSVKNGQKEKQRNR